QAEDGIRDWSVTGVQTCALPISKSNAVGITCTSVSTTWQWTVTCVALDWYAIEVNDTLLDIAGTGVADEHDTWNIAGIDGIAVKIGRASCRERVEIGGDARAGKT